MRLNSCFVSEGIDRFEWFRESVINKSFITTVFCFLSEQMIEWRHASLNKTVTYRHLLAILVLNLHVSLRFKMLYCINNTLYGMVRYDCDEWGGGFCAAVVRGCCFYFMFFLFIIKVFGRSPVPASFFLIYELCYNYIKHDIKLIRLEKHCLKVKHAPVNQCKVANIVS